MALAARPLAAKEAHTASAGQGLSPANPAYLLELIVADLHWSTLQVGSLVLMAGVCAGPGATLNLHTSRHLVYDDTKVMRLALRYGEGAGLPTSLRNSLDLLYAQIGGLQVQLAPFAAAATLSAGQREQLGRLMPSLRKVAVLAAERLSEMESFGRTALRPEYAADSAAIRQYLSRAARGDFGDINRYGVLTPPRLNQRRQSPRVSVNRRCRIVSPAGEFDATLLDASRSGLGISCDAPLGLGMALTVVVGERRLEASVQRRDGRQAGLSLKRSLPVDDPLFKAG